MLRNPTPLGVPEHFREVVQHFFRTRVRIASTDATAGLNVGSSMSRIAVGNIGHLMEVHRVVVVIQKEFVGDRPAPGLETYCLSIFQDWGIGQWCGFRLGTSDGGRRRILAKNMSKIT